MAANVIEYRITAKDEASGAVAKLCGYLDNNTRVVANRIREAFAGLFGGALSGAMDFEVALEKVQAKGQCTD